MMVRNLLVSGLIAAFGLVAVSPDAEARHCCRRVRCCQSWGGVSYQQTAVYQQPMAFASTCCNAQPACVAQGWNGQGQGFYQNGQYQSGYQQDGTIAPAPAQEFQGQPLNNDPNLRVQPQQGQPIQRGATQPPREPQAVDQSAPQPRTDRAPQRQNQPAAQPRTESNPPSPEEPNP